MTAIIMKAELSDSWEDDWESTVETFVESLKAPAPQVNEVKTLPKVTTAPPTKTFSQRKNPYAKYPYFMAGLQGTLLKQLYPRSALPIGDLKRDLASGKLSLQDVVIAVRNDYIMPLYNVTKSTKYFNPVSKMRVPITNKKERFDPKLLTHVSLEDQLKVYRLFGFQGHQGKKKSDDDSNRDELLAHLRDILYNADELAYVMALLLNYRMYVDVDEAVLKRVCSDLHTHERYNEKSFTLPAKWFHDATWKKLNYVHGESKLDNFGGGDGQMDRDLAAMMVKADSYKK